MSRLDDNEFAQTKYIWGPTKAIDSIDVVYSTPSGTFSRLYRTRGF